MLKYCLALIRRAPKDFRDKAEFFGFWGPVAFYIVVLAGASVPNWAPATWWDAQPSSVKVGAVFALVLYEVLWLGYRMHEDIAGSIRRQSDTTSKHLEELRRLAKRGGEILNDWLNEDEVYSPNSNDWKKEVRQYFDTELSEHAFELSNTHAADHKKQDDPGVRYVNKQALVNKHIDVQQNVFAVIRKLEGEGK